MKSAEEQLHKILTVYCTRAGDLLLKLADPAISDEALAKAFTLQKSAFHNFVSLEAKYAASGFDVMSYPSLFEKGREAGLLCQEVESALGSVIEKTSKSLAVTGRSKRNLSVYHSGQPVRNRFIKGA